MKVVPKAGFLGDKSSTPLQQPSPRATDASTAQPMGSASKSDLGGISIAAASSVMG